MLRFSFRRWTAGLLVMGLLAGGAPAAFAHHTEGEHGHPATAAATPIHIFILHTNDMHGHVLPEVDKKVAPETEKVGGAAYLAAFIQRERAKHVGSVLLIDSGDIAQGTPISNLFKGKPVVDYMTALQYDAGTVGNHEFDWNPSNFANLVRWQRHPVVCANLVMKATHQSPAGIKEFILKKVGGVTVGITGVVTPTTPHISFSKNVAPFVFQLPADALRRVMPKMKQAGAQVIVVSSHLGVDDDRALAEAVPGIHVIVGGHSHTPLLKPLFVNNTVIVQAGKYMKYLGELDVAIDPKTWKVVDYTKDAELIPVIDSQIKPDPKVLAMVQKYQDQVAPAMDQVLGQAAADLTKTPADGQTDCVLGNLITDALRAKMDTDFAVYNAGGIRSDINKGPIRVGDVYTLLPFDNYVVSMSLTGQQVQTLLGQGLGDRHGTIQVSDTVSFAIGAEGKPKDIRIKGQPLDLTRTYTLATVDFLADGNDGLTVLKGVKYQIDELARDVFASYVRRHSPVQAPVGGRIKTTASTSAH